MNMVSGSRRSILISNVKDPKAEENRLIQESGFTKTQIEDIKEHIKRLETQKPSGTINKYELFDILKGFKLESLKIFFKMMFVYFVF
jgi:Ca2+-binding EF-hand superfamily protein